MREKSPATCPTAYPVVCAVHGLGLYPPVYDTSEAGSEAGCEEGSELGCEEGSELGCDEGSELGCTDGSELGCADGSDDGCADGSDDGCADGSDDGCAVGSDVSDSLFVSAHARIRVKGSIVVYRVCGCSHIVYDSVFCWANFIFYFGVICLLW